jgi:glycolate oxidase FAD binding subunit
VSATTVSAHVASELRAICGDANTRERPAGGVYVSPNSPEEVAAALRLANEHKLSVGVAGGSTEYSAAALCTDIVVHTNRLTQIEHYDHADLTVGVGAGTTVAQLNAMVGADQLTFAGDPPLPERCTVGGLLATAGHGPLRHGFGGVRDYCIGVRFVTGDARRAKGGGRVVKNVAGYDLMKLLIGSYGTLGIITSASFKLFPAPRQTRTFLAEFATAQEALGFRERVMRSPLSPMCLELVSPGARKMMRPDMLKDVWVMCVRASGSDTVLARYRKELGSAVSRELAGDGEIKMWHAIRRFAMDSAARRFHVNVPLRDVLAAVEASNSVSGMAEIDVGMIGRVGVGHLLVAVPDATGEASARIDVLINALRTRFTDISIKVEGAANPWPIPPVNLASMQAVKQALDPNNVLRGRQTT